MQGDHGAAAVEFALCLPVLALLVCGVIDLGRWYSAWNETKNAAREGALYAQTHPNQQTTRRPVCDRPEQHPGSRPAGARRSVDDRCTFDRDDHLRRPAVLSPCNDRRRGGAPRRPRVTVKVERDRAARSRRSSATSSETP